MQRYNAVILSEDGEPVTGFGFRIQRCHSSYVSCNKRMKNYTYCMDKEDYLVYYSIQNKHILHDGTFFWKYLSQNSTKLFLYSALAQTRLVHYEQRQQQQRSKLMFRTLLFISQLFAGGGWGRFSRAGGKSLKMEKNGLHGKVFLNLVNFHSKRMNISR